MKTLQPFDSLVIVKALRKEEKQSLIVMPDTHQGRYTKYVLLDIGPTVSWKDKVKVGDIVIGNPPLKDEILDGYIDGAENTYLKNSHEIFAKEVTSGPKES